MNKSELIRACETVSDDNSLKSVVMEALAYLKKNDRYTVRFTQSDQTVEHVRKIYKFRLKSAKERNFFLRGLEETTSSLISIPDHLLVSSAHIIQDEKGPYFFFDPSGNIIGCYIPNQDNGNQPQ
jgi:hypothetical protein